MHIYIRQAFQSGALLLWNQHQFIGYPIIADPQAALFYPATWLMWLIGVVRGMNLALAFHIWLGAWGMAIFTRRFQASYAGSLLAGMIYATSEWMASRLYAGHVTIVQAAAWIPWAMVAFEYAHARRTWRSALPGIACTGLLLLAGSPPIILYGAIALFTLWLYHVVQADYPLKEAGYGPKLLV